MADLINLLTNENALATQNLKLSSVDAKERSIDCWFIQQKMIKVSISEVELAQNPDLTNLILARIENLKTRGV